MTDAKLHYVAAVTEFGKLHFVADDNHLFAIAFDQNWPLVKKQIEKRFVDLNRKPIFLKGANAVIIRIQKELSRYHSGSLKEFTTPISMFGTEFEMSAWKQLLKINYGKTRTYRQQAVRLQKPLAVRAVAAANARNPLAIVIPCHRLTGEDGRLTGYSGGIETKQKLLDLELHGTAAVSKK